MSETASKILPLGTDLPDFNLIGTDGGMNAPRDFATFKVMVVAFICNHCPYAKSAIPTLIKLQEQYLKQEVIFIGINANDPEAYPEDDLEHMTKYAQDWGLNFPYLVDETQDVAKAFGAVCTPDLFVYDRDRKLAYHGRIDELDDAIKALLVGGAPTLEQHPSIGCSIKWRA